MDPKPYLDYLDKEMTIMGILSAFSVAALGGVFTILTKADQIGPTLWSGGSVFLVAGSAYCLIAASLFYKQGGWPIHKPILGAPFIRVLCG